MRGHGRVAHAHLGDTRKRRLQSREQLALHLRIEAIAREGLLDVTADVLVEDERIGDPIGVLAVHAHLGVHVEAEVRVDDTERNRRSRAVFVPVDFLRVEVVDTLVLARVATERKALADTLKRRLDALAKRAVEDRRLSRAVIGELAGLGAHVDDLAGFDDDHALAIVHGNNRAIGDDVALALRVRAAALVGCTLLALRRQRVFVEHVRVAVEELAPRISKHATCRTGNRLDQTHLLLLSVVLPLPYMIAQLLEQKAIGWR